MNYADRLDQAVLSKGNPCLVGLDPHLSLMPEEFTAVRDPEATRQECAGDVIRFLIGILDAVADIVLFLASDAGRMCTSQTFVVDAGWT